MRATGFVMCIGMLACGFVSSPSSAECVNYGDYLHWAGFGDLVHQLSGFDFGGISISGDHAYVAACHCGFQVVDITHRTRPRTIATIAGDAHDVVVRGQYAYVATDGGGGLLVVDISRPDAPTIVGSLPGNYQFGRGIDLSKSKQYLYLVDYFDGLKIIDVRDPHNPFVVGTADTGWSLDVSLATGIAWVTNGDLAAVDVSDPTHPQILGTLQTPRTAVTVKVRGSYAYVFDESQSSVEGDLLVVNISDPQAPRVVSSTHFDGWSRGILIDGDRAYLTCGGLVALDIADPENPVVLGSAFAGHSISAALLDQYAYVVDGNWKIQVVDTTHPESISTVSTAPTQCVPYGLSVSGDRAYVAEMFPYLPPTGRLEIFDVADPAAPRLMGSVETAMWAYDLALVGGYAYVSGDPMMQVVDVRDPGQPAIISSEPVTARAIATSDQHAFLTAYPGLQVMDISDPYDPLPVAELTTPSYVEDIVILGQLAYLAEDVVGLQIVDVSDPLAPRIIGTATLPGGGSIGNCRGVTVEGSRAYAVDGDSLLHVIDIADPQHPVQIGTSRVSVSAWSRGPDALAAGGTLYIAGNGLEVLDISPGLRRPGLVGGNWTGVAYRVALSDDYVFVTVYEDYDSGSLEILPRQCPRERDDPFPVGATAEAVSLAPRLIACPNPTAGRTAIRLDLGHLGAVSAGIYDTSGRRVRHLLGASRGGASAGGGVLDIIWDRRDDAGRTVPAGIYLVRATTSGGGASTARVVVLE